MGNSKQLVFSLTRSAFEWEYFRVSGPGGQGRDKNETGARCRHRPSGAVGESREHRGQLENKRSAFRRCCESNKFQMWAKGKAMSLPPIEDVVDAMMQPASIKVEIKHKGKWMVVE